MVPLEDLLLPEPGGAVEPGLELAREPAWQAAPATAAPREPQAPTWGAPVEAQREPGVARSTPRATPAPGVRHGPEAQPQPAAAAARPDPGRRGRLVALVAISALAGATLLGGGLFWLRRPPPAAGPARLEGVPPVAPEPPAAAAAPSAAKPSVPTAAAAPGNTAAPAAGAARRPGPEPREERLYAGRPLAWWNERLRVLRTVGGEEALRLRAITLRRAAGLGLRERPSDDGSVLEPVAEAP